MKAPISCQIQGQHWWLSSQRCIYWEEQQAVLVSDLHFGKSGHFRKAGIAVPQDVFREDLQRFVQVLMHFKPARVIVAGDLFHSTANKELDWFLRWRETFSHMDFHLIRGNHDVLSPSWYETASIIVHPRSWTLGPFTFIHDQQHVQDEQETYLVHGHLHPGIRLRGMGRQSLRFPCFYLGESYAVLPAYSRFSGLALIEPTPKDLVYAIVDDELVKIG